MTTESKKKIFIASENETYKITYDELQLLGKIWLTPIIDIFFQQTDTAL